MRVNFVTYSDLYRDTLELERRLPRDIVGVIGIPRSGMLPASIIALHRNLPLGTMADCTAVRCNNGHRLNLRSDCLCLDAEPWTGRWLVIDDSIYKGSSMQCVKAYMRSDFPNIEAIYAAVYGSLDTPADRNADYIGRIVPANRYFAWNLFHHDDLKNAMLDLDGVLCCDPPITDSIDEQAYAAWLPKAEPFNVPSVPIGAVCTNRLVKHHDETVAWLRRNKIVNGKLFMSTAESPAERSMEACGEFKGRAYRDSIYSLFIESDRRQAAAIARIANKPVISIDTGEVFQ